jgi:DNA-directed RNA polymerase specialized sigma24 family protein
MHNSDKFNYSILLDVFKEWFKYNRKHYFKEFVDEAELLNEIISMDQHIIDKNDLFLKWEKIYNELNNLRLFKLYMSKVFRNSVLEIFREKQRKIKTVAGEFGEKTISDTEESDFNSILNYEIEDLCQKIHQLLQDDIEKDKNLRKIFKLISFYYLEERTLENISRSTGMTVSMIYRQIQKGLLHLRERISEILQIKGDRKLTLAFDQNEKKIFGRLLALIISDIEKQVKS